MTKKLPRYLTTLKKDIELQIDYMIGYRPQGLHWKQESHLRAKMIDEAVGSDWLPEDQKQKLITMLDTLITLREQEEQEQPYYKATKIKKEIPYIGHTNPIPKQKIKVRDRVRNKEYYI